MSRIPTEIELKVLLRSLNEFDGFHSEKIDKGIKLNKSEELEHSMSLDTVSYLIDRYESILNSMGCKTSDEVPDPEEVVKEVERNSKKAMRFNDGKRKWSLVHFKSLEPMIQVLEYGCQKYSPDNWKKGLDKKEILESMMRHLASLMDGESYDKESNLHHIGHILCNSMFYSYFENNK